MKKNIKAILIVLILFLAGAAAVLGINVARTYFSGAQAGVVPQGVRIDAESTSASISWQSDKESMGVVEYGTNQASLLLRAVETNPVISHQVVLSPLKQDTTYYFRIRIDDIVYDNNGIPYSFKTKPSSVSEDIFTPPIDQFVETPFVPQDLPSDAEYGGDSLPGPSEELEQPILVNDCIIDDFKEKMGSSDSAYDFNKDGIVNTADWLECLKVNQ